MIIFFCLYCIILKNIFCIICKGFDYQLHAINNIEFKMTQRFNKNMQQKFLKDLQNVQLGQDSDMEDSIGDSYYQNQKKQIEQAMKALRSKQKNNIIEQIKKQKQYEDAYCDQYEDDVGQLQDIIQNKQKNVIEASTLQEIKTKVFNESKMHNIVLSDEIVQKNVVKKQENRVRITKKEQTKNKQIDHLLIKQQRMNLERQNLTMQRQDQYSKKYELAELSRFFKQRFVQPQFIVPHSSKSKIKIMTGNPEQTFSNKMPLPNTQENVFSKNSPEMAMRRINKTKKIKLVPSSTSKATIKFKEIIQANNPQVIEYKASKNVTQQIQTYLVKCFQDLQKKSSDMQRLSSQYSPKFINQFENKAEQNLMLDSDVSSKSLKQCMQVQDPLKLKDITFAFQRINNTEGISNYPQVQQIGLQYNLLTNLIQLDKCSKLIQLNVSHNKIKSIITLQNLQHLRILNIQENQIDYVRLQGGSLQFLYASHNRIQQIQISSNQFLKKIILNNNNLKTLSNLNINKNKKLYFLQQINVSKNYLKDLDGIQNCIMLRFLDASNNRIQSMLPDKTDFVFVFLNKLVLNNNNLNALPTLFLPSLEELYMDRNKLQCKGQGFIYLPELKLLNLDENRLNGFNSVFNTIKYSQNLETLKYDKNTYFLQIRQKVRQLYQHIVYTNMNKLALLNQGAFDIGMKKYYEGAYSIYLSSVSALQPSQKKLEQIHQRLMFNLRENKLIGQIEEKKSRFSATKEFIQFKTLRKITNFQQIVAFVQKNKSKNISYLSAKNSLFFVHDQYTLTLKKSIRKIQSAFIQYKYKKNKRKNYFIKQKQRIKQAIKPIDSFCFKILLLKCVQAFKEPLFQQTFKKKQQQAAIMIQKTFKMYRIRKRYLKAIGKLRPKSEQQEFPEIDLDDFGHIETFQLDLQIPDQYNFQQYIIRPQIFQRLQQKQQQRNNKYNQNQVQKLQRQQKNERMVNNFVDNNNSGVSQRSGNQRNNNTHQQQISKIMANWGMSRQAAQVYLLKQKKKQKIKKIDAEKNLSASERYNRFKKGR